MTEDLILEAALGMLNILGEHYLKTDLLLLNVIRRILAYFHLIFRVLQWSH